MPGASEKTSSVIRDLTARGLFERLPPTFSTFCYDQIKDWSMLFPAEQSYFERLLGLLNRLPPEKLDQLFAPMRAAEKQMAIGDHNWDRRSFSLDQVDLLNRSPHYGVWRAAVAALFVSLEPELDAEIARRGRARLVVVIVPSELPVGPDRMWTRIASQGVRVPVAVPEAPADYLPLLLTGAPRAEQAPSLLDRYAASTPAPAAYSAWAIEAGEDLAAWVRNPAVVRLSYAALAGYRARLMSEVQRVVDDGSIRGPKQLGMRLKTLTVRSSESAVSSDPLLAEFLRASLLNGNGTLLLNNTFVEWSTVQAIRRARPSVAFIHFGIRNKVKPFSNLLIYTDQESASIVPAQADTLGSYVDLEIFQQYVFQEFSKYPEYRGNTAYLFAGDGMDEMLILGAPDFPLRAGSDKPVALQDTFAHAKDWLRL